MSAIYGLVILLAILAVVVETKGSHKVQCSDDFMKVDIVLLEDQIDPSSVYLEGMKGYPDPKCQPKFSDNHLARFQLSLLDFYECGVTRILYKLNGRKVFYHKVIIETPNGKEYVSVKCLTTAPSNNLNNTRTSHSLARREVDLPLGFEEPIDLDIMSLDARAPDPTVGIEVKQGGQRVTDELNVSPGTPLSMEIYLDDTSAPIYGLGVTYMQVTDTRSQEEIIIFNGCSVDPYLFENFDTVDGDRLTAKFRAFKFPDTTYVQFRSTVNACVDRCQGIKCSNGQIGFGRRKRDVMHSSEQNKVYEISKTTFIRVSGEPANAKDEETVNELKHRLDQLKLANQKLQRNSRGSVLHSVNDESALIHRSSVYESNQSIRAQVTNTASVSFQSITAILLALTFNFWIQSFVSRRY